MNADTRVLRLTSAGLPGLALIVLALMAFGGVLRNGFVYDDLWIIHGNPLFSTRPGLAAIFSGDYFTWSRQGSYRPMVTLSYMFDGMVWGGGPFGFHLTNLLLHLANTLLLFVVALRWGVAKQAAFLGAALFAVHPVFTEVVSFPNYREDLLVLFFCLGAVGCLGPWEHRTTGPQDHGPRTSSQRSVNSEQLAVSSGTVGPQDHGTTGPQDSGIKAPITDYGLRIMPTPTPQRGKLPHSHTPILWVISSALLYGCALLSKESALGFLLFLVFCAWRFDGFRSHGPTVPRSHGPTVPRSYGPTVPRSYGPFLAVTALYLFLRFGVFGESNELTPPHVGGSLLLNLFTMCGVAFSYLGLLAFPVHLRAEYVVTPVGSAGEVLASLAGLLLLLAGIVLVLRPGRRIGLAAGLGWCLVFLAPVMNLHPIAHPMAERYLYLPCAGAFLLVGVGLHGLGARMRSAGARHTASVAMASIFLCFILLAWERVAECRDNFHLWKAAVRCEPDSAIARQNLGVEYLELDRLEEALRQFQRAWELRPSPQLRLNIARTQVALARQTSEEGETLNAAIDKAVGEYRQVLKESSGTPRDQALLHHEIALFFRQASRFDEALAEHRQAKALDPLSDSILLHEGITRQKMGQLETAMELYRQALKLFRSRAQTHYNLGTALEALERLEEAQDAYTHALQLAPEYPEAHGGLATVLLRLGKPEAALNHFESALAHHPHQSVWRFHYAVALLRLNQAEEARRQLQAISPPESLPPSLRKAMEQIQQRIRD